jgi:hypothetical protein
VTAVNAGAGLENFILLIGEHDSVGIPDLLFGRQIHAASEKRGKIDDILAGCANVGMGRLDPVGEPPQQYQQIVLGL